jgi:hypothetical protein
MAVPQSSIRGWYFAGAESLRICRPTYTIPSPVSSAEHLQPKTHHLICLVGFLRGTVSGMYGTLHHNPLCIVHRTTPKRMLPDSDSPEDS